MDFPRYRGPVLPLEICGMVIRECFVPISGGDFQWDSCDSWRDRSSTLRSCSLTCRGWHQYAQPLLFHTVYAATKDEDYRSIPKLAAVVHEKPELGWLVKSLIIDGRTGDPSWVAVTLHGRWFPKLANLTVLSGRVGAPHELTPRNFYKFLASYRSSVQQLHLHHSDARLYGHGKISVLHALSSLTHITHLEVSCLLQNALNPSSIAPLPHNSPGSNMLRSLIVRGDTTPRAIDNLIIPMVKKGTISLESLEFLYAKSSPVVGSTSGLIRRCSMSLRELYLVNDGFRTSLPSEDPLADISLSSLHGLRRLYCSDVAVSQIISMLKTLPIPSTLTQLDIAGRSFNFDNEDAGYLVFDDLPWRELDTTLSSSAFPLLCSLNIVIIFGPQRSDDLESHGSADDLESSADDLESSADDSDGSVQRKIEKLEDWLSGCFNRGIVRLVCAYDDKSHKDYHYDPNTLDDLDNARRHLGFIHR